jgi:TolB-like protein/DNA-binding winged helix-turn-helix (wHTH) protein/Flp pilus assembly protein TadD
MAGNAPRGYRFATFEVDLRSGELRKNGIKIKLQDQPFKVLALLLERKGDLVTREELIAHLWPDGTVVEYDHSLNTAVTRIREALGDAADNPRFVQTLPRRGYRFIGALETIPGEQATPPPPAAPEPEAVPHMTVPPPMATVAETHRVAWRVWAWRAAGLMALLVVVWRVWVLPHRLALPEGQIRMVVLPFQNLSGDPKEDYFSAGITEEMISQMGRLKPERIVVIAYGTSERVAGRPLDQLGKDLNAHFAVEGSVRRDGEQVRITARLIQLRDQSQVWTNSFDRSLQDVLELQSDVVHAILTEMEVRLEPARAPRPVQREAYQAYQLGRLYWNRRTDEDLLKSIEYQKRAVALDPEYALAHASLADAYNLAGYYSIVPPAEAYPQAKAAAQRALTLDPTLAEAHAALADIAYLYDRDWPAAQREFRRALELRPNYATARQWYGTYLALLGKNQEARAELEQALAIDPLSPVINADLGLVHYYARDWDAAIEQFRKTVELDPNFSLTRNWLGLALLQKGQSAEAVQEFETAMRLSKGSVGSYALLSLGLARAGRRQEAFVKLRELEASGATRYVSPAYLSLIYMGLGDTNQAFALAAQAVEHRAPLLARMKVEPALDPLRKDPRYPALMKRVGLP